MACDTTQKQTSTTKQSITSTIKAKETSKVTKQKNKQKQKHKKSKNDNKEDFDYSYFIKNGKELIKEEKQAIDVYVTEGENTITEIGVNI